MIGYMTLRPFSKPFVLGALIVALIALFFVHKINAQNGAIIINSDTNCGVFDAEGNMFTTGYQAVITKSNSGTITLKCQADNVPNNTGKVIKFDYASTNIPCVFFTKDKGLQISENWKEVLTPSGNASYICHLKNE